MGGLGGLVDQRTQGGYLRLRFPPPALVDIPVAARGQEPGSRSDPDQAGLTDTDSGRARRRFLCLTRDVVVLS
ncbi:hypothetical protein SAMN05216268_106307 [Streptomyces yunnanensis]|nr:hypothetical protein SAMN05216268_106307 [Streptomyces yunnanensis]